MAGLAQRARQPPVARNAEKTQSIPISLRPEVSWELSPLLEEGQQSPRAALLQQLPAVLVCGLVPELWISHDGGSPQSCEIRWTPRARLRAASLAMSRSRYLRLHAPDDADVYRDLFA